MVSSGERQKTADLLSSVAAGFGLAGGPGAFDRIVGELHRRILNEPVVPQLSPIRHVLLLVSNDPKVVTCIRSGAGLSRPRRNSLANLADGYDLPLSAVALVDRISEELVAAFQRGASATSYEPSAAAARNEAALASLVAAVSGDWLDRIDIQFTADEVSLVSCSPRTPRSRVRVAAYDDQYEFQLYRGGEHVITISYDQANGETILRRLLTELDGPPGADGT